MPAWVESEIRNRLWLWLEEEYEYDVYPEVEIEGGRIDLVAKDPSGEYIGFEVKGCPETSSKILKQLKTYEMSGYLDRLYFVSNTTKYLTELFEDSSGEVFIDWKMGLPSEFLDINMEYAESPDEEEPALRLLEKYVGDDWDFISLAESVGIIRVPLNVEREDRKRVKITQECDNILQSEISKPPEIIRDAETLTRDRTISTPVKEEQMQYRLWREFGGIPEGSLPHPVTGSGRDTLNIDLITFQDAVTATQSLESEGEVIGIEVKTKSGLKGNRVEQQLKNYVLSECINKLYLSVPHGSVSEAKQVISKLNFEKASEVGILKIKGNEVIETKEAGILNQRYDAYGSEEYPNYVGYGNTSIPHISDPKSHKLD